MTKEKGKKTGKDKRIGNAMSSLSFIACTIFVLALAGLASAKVHYINTADDSADVAIGNDGDIVYDSGLNALSIGGIPSADYLLNVHTTTGNGVFVETSASLGNYGVYSSSSSADTYGVLVSGSDEGARFESDGGEVVNAYSAYGIGLNASTTSGYAGLFNKKVIFNSYFSSSSLGIGSVGLADVAIFGQGETYGIYGNTTGSGNAFGVYGDGGSMGNGVYGISTGDIGVLGNGSAGVKGQSASSSNRYGLLGTDDYGIYGQYDSSHFGYLGGSYYGLYGDGGTSTGLYALGDTVSAELQGDIIISDGSFIEIQNGDENIMLSDNDPTWFDDSYGSVTEIHGDGNLYSGLLSTGGMNLSRHAVAEPIAGKWYCNDSDTVDGSGTYWDWDNEVYSTSNVFSWTAGGDYVTVNGASYPGYYEICWNLRYSSVTEGSYVYTTVRVGGTSRHGTLQGGHQYASINSRSCVIWQFTSSETVGLYDTSNDNSYNQVGSTSSDQGRYSWLMITKLN